MDCGSSDSGDTEQRGGRTVIGWGVIAGEMSGDWRRSASGEGACRWSQFWGERRIGENWGDVGAKRHSTGLPPCLWTACAASVRLHVTEPQP